LGEAVRYDGGDCVCHLDIQAKIRIKSWQQQGLLLSLCPEVAGGLPVPRPAAEIQGSQVKTLEGDDVTKAFQQGAERALSLCQHHDIKIAILKQGSPSCGNTLINDGSFSKRKIAGQGITARLLQKHGITVFNENQLEQIEQYLSR